MTAAKSRLFSCVFLSATQGQLVGGRSRTYEQLEVRAKKRSTALDLGWRPDSSASAAGGFAKGAVKSNKTWALYERR